MLMPSGTFYTYPQQTPSVPTENPLWDFLQIPGHHEHGIKRVTSTSMENLLHIALEAHDDTANHHQAYSRCPEP